MGNVTLANKNLSLEYFIANSPDKREWVNGQLVEKNGITLKHGKIQLRLGRDWDDYKNSSKQGGEVFIQMYLVVLINKGDRLMLLLLLN